MTPPYSFAISLLAPTIPKKKPFLRIAYHGGKMCFTYALQYYDKALLSQAAIFGLRDDLDLQSGLRYSWVSLIFYFGYMGGCYPVSIGPWTSLPSQTSDVSCLHYF